MTDYRWLTPETQQFLENGYLLKNQTVDERVDIIANKAEEILGLDGYASKFKEYFSKGWFSLSTPIWSNFGTDRGLPISCFNSHIEDSMESILSAHAEVGMMSKLGGGTSGYFGELRPRGSEIKNNGVSFGAVHFMKLFENLINVVSQGSTRRGNFAAYLPIDHEDIEEFLEIRHEGNPIQDLFTGVTVPEGWMQSMIDGDKDKRKIWAKVLHSRTNTGFPYIFFSDNVNNNTVDVYKDKGLKVNSSNLCVAGNQRVVSNRGLLTAKELYDEGGELTLYDNKKKVKASEMKLVEKNADVYKITLQNGMSHNITSYHKVVVSSRTNGHDESEKPIACKNLKIGDRVAIQTTKGLFGSKSMKDEAFLLGIYQSDGTQHDLNIMLDVWENDFDILEEIQEKFNNIHYKYKCDKYRIDKSDGSFFERGRKPAVFHDCAVSTGTVAKKRLSSRILKKALNFTKGRVPDWLWESDEETQWEYIRGLLIAYGTAHLNKSIGNPIQIAYADINKEFLEELQILFQNLGLQTSIRLLREAGESLLPDGKGGSKLYKTKDCWRLIIGNKNDALTIEEKTGFLSRKNIELEDKNYRDNTKKYYKIDNIEYIGKEDVYCCKVDSNEHLWVCNGLITHNCSEILLSSTEDESFVCDLSSMNIHYYDEWKDTDAIEVITFLLDAVMTEFIEKASKYKYMERSVNFAKNQRALGIGWLGWHSYLQSKMIPFESMEAKLKNSEIAKLINEKAWDASKKLAELFGEPPLLKGYGRRNSTLTAIAPTKSSAFILGMESEGIEPHRSNYFIKDLQKGKFSVKNKELEKLLDSKDRNTKEVWKSILENSGSVQHLDFLSDDEKSVFKTFIEISPMEIIIQAGQRQKYIDQSQSLNLMIDPKVPTKELNNLVIEAWKQGVKTLYYQISVNAAQQLSRSLSSCESCSA